MTDSVIRNDRPVGSVPKVAQVSDLEMTWRAYMFIQQLMRGYRHRVCPLETKTYCGVYGPIVEASLQSQPHVEC